jgi:hypothetical protein
MFLLILKEYEFDKTTSTLLPAIKITTNIHNVLPSEKQTWAWAHVQVNTQVTQSNFANLSNLLNTEPDTGISRLLSPRRLEPNTRYFAFLIPAFEAGRLVGLGQANSCNNKQLSSWVLPTDISVDIEDSKKIFPYYYNWEFSTTGKGEDFETLARKIKPKQLTEADAGKRDLGISNPGFPAIKNAFESSGPDERIVNSYGALMPFASGGAEPELEVWTIPTLLPDSTSVRNKYMSELSKLVNETVISTVDGSADPILGPPLYGQYHMQVEKIDVVNTNWLNKVNLDPTFRSMAGLGSAVVKKNQEKFMDIAWQQVSGVLEANKQIKQLQAALLTVKSIYNKNIATGTSTGNNNPVSFTASLLPVIKSGTTLKSQIKASNLPNNSINPVFLKMARPSGPVMKRINAVSTTPASSSSVMKGFNNSTVVIAAPYVKPVTVSYAPPSLQTTMTVSTVQNLPVLSNFNLVKPGTYYTVVSSGSNTNHANQFKQALTTFYTNVQNIPAPASPKPELNWNSFVGIIKEKLNPDTTFLNLANNLFDYYKGSTTPSALPNLELIMAAPIIPISMAEAMADISPDFLMPGIGKLEQNGAYMLNMNQKIVEAYLAGANYEMNRELLWREYPTDQRGTPLRHFWGTKNVGATTFIDSDEKNMDIKPIHSWKTVINGIIYPKNLGDNTNRTASGMVVLAIRGELLKKFPNTNIYMQKATWNVLNGNGDITSTLLAAGKPRNIAPASITTIKKPLFFSQINPDLYFVGFEITATDAKGSSTPNTTNPGWFVCFEERAGEIVFGADETDLSKISDPYFNVKRDIDDWDSLQWGHLYNSKIDSEPKFINIATISQIKSNKEPDIIWASNSSDMAYTLFQKPSRVFIHSNDMLA